MIDVLIRESDNEIIKGFQHNQRTNRISQRDQGVALRHVLGQYFFSQKAAYFLFFLKFFLTILIFKICFKRNS